jgi:hypothetical protein
MAPSGVPGNCFHQDAAACRDIRAKPRRCPRSGSPDDRVAARRLAGVAKTSAAGCARLPGTSLADAALRASPARGA